MAEPWLPAPPRLAGLGFIDDPFGAPDAEGLAFEALNETFVEPEPVGPGPAEAAARSIYALVRDPGRSVAVVGPPGAGKTALRRMVEDWLRSVSPSVCLVRLGGLERLAAQETPPTLADYVRPVLSSITAAVTELFLARPELILSADEHGRRWWWAFLLRYPAAETLEVQLQGSPRLQESFEGLRPLGALFSPDAGLADLLAAVLRRLAPLGYGRMAILVDSIDNLVDTAQPDRGAAALATLLGPVLRTQGLFRIQDLVWKLFLPEALAPALDGAAPVQSSWLAVQPLAWTPAGLDALLARRLEWASRGLYSSLEQISEEPLTLSEEPLLTEPGSPLHRRLAALALAHPRLGPVRSLLSLASELTGGDGSLLTLAEWRGLLARHEPAAARPAAAAATGHAPARIAAAQRTAHAGDDNGRPPICDLTITLDLARKTVGVAEMSFVNHAGSQRRQLLRTRTATRLRLDAQDLIERHSDPLAYGPTLTDHFFAPREVYGAFVEAYARAEGANAKLRIRLALSDRDPRLHAFRWELLQHPKADRPRFLCLEDRVLFSRSLPLRGNDGRLRGARRPLTSLVAIATPEQGNAYNLGELPVEELFDAVERAQPGGNLTRLSEVSLSQLDRFQPPDLIVLVCHGRVEDGQPILYLHGDDRRIKPIAGESLLEYLAGRTQKPTFWVLASCQSAGRDRNDDALALNALGPQLARIGVGAVLAFADNVEIDAIRVGLPLLVEQLHAHGQIELAVAAMRLHLNLKGQAWWQSVIYLGLDNGRLWR